MEMARRPPVLAHWIDYRMTQAKATAQSVTQKIAEITSFHFSDTSLLEQALRHKSITGMPSYERLEFLGDRVLGIIISEILYNRFPDADQGELTMRFHALTQEGYLAQIADKTGLAKLISSASNDIGLRASVKSDVVESLIAALYTEGGIEPVRQFIMRYWQFPDALPDNRLENPKSALQEWSAQHKLGVPRYTLVSRTGSDHNPCFTASVEIDGFPALQAEGATIKAAERQAAAKLLAKLLKTQKS